jgi:hypothetical protein
MTHDALIYKISEKITINVGDNDSSHEEFSEACSKDGSDNDNRLGGTEFCKQLNGKCMLCTRLVINFPLTLPSCCCFSHSTIQHHLYMSIAVTA